MLRLGLSPKSRLGLILYCGCRQGHLEEAIAQSQQRADEAEELRVLLEKKTSKELEGLKATYAVKNHGRLGKRKSSGLHAHPKKKIPRRPPCANPQMIQAERAQHMP